MKVFPPEVSTFYRHIFELQKLICNTVRQTHAAFLEPLGHSRDIARLSLFDKYYFSSYLSKFNELVPLPNSRGLSTRYSVKLHGFLSQLLDIVNMIILTVSFSVQLGSDILYL